MVPGFEAPIFVSWAHKNRSDLIRIPSIRKGRDSDTRIEIRSPDSACNPYLSFACMLAAGLEGIEKNYEPVDPVEENVHELSAEDRQARGIVTLPSDLNEAIKLAEDSTIMKETFGEELHSKIIANKKLELEKSRRQVTDFELDNYLTIL